MGNPFDELIDKEQVTMTKGQLKELIRDAIQEAVEKDRKARGRTPEITKEQILNVKDNETRQRLISRNRHLFT